MNNGQNYTGLEIAVIGMACRFPDANNWGEYWQNLINGVESIKAISPEELVALGLPNELFDDPNYVKVRSLLQGKNYFDSAFFGYRPAEARLMNPVHRLFHECVWEAFEDACYDPEKFDGPIGIFAGSGDDLNWKVYAKMMNQEQDIDDMTLHLISSKDTLASLIAYKFNLRGPAISINTTCSTSLVAINLACKSLLLGESRMALAGGATIISSIQKGYFYRDGFINSKDGHCKPFDSNASGTVPGEGVGVVVLKRLADAIADADQIHCIIKGGAINGDGRMKVGFTAPSVQGQTDCLNRAYKFAKVDPITVSYVEAHGTATALGDPIEVEALNAVYQRRPPGECALGSVKGNIGHLDAAAGVAGFIKAALVLKNERIPPSLYFRSPNPELNFNHGPFYVNALLSPLKRSGSHPLRVAVSSFGLGGTNAHIVLEQAPSLSSSERQNSDPALILLSGKTESALQRNILALSDFVEQVDTLNVNDVAHSLQIGRREFVHRFHCVAGNREELLKALRNESSGTHTVQAGQCRKIFMFPGQGSHYSGAGNALYEKNDTFRQKVDEGLRYAADAGGLDYRAMMFDNSAGTEKHIGTEYGQVLLFVLEYSIASLMHEIGVVPEYLIGHSVGEYTAACVSGVFDYQTAIRLLVRRGKLMRRIDEGLMLAAGLTESSAMEYLGSGVSLACINAPGQIVFSGAKDAIAQLELHLLKAGTGCTRLQNGAFHSALVEPILEEFENEFVGLNLKKPKIPFVSNLTGKFITEEEATSPSYWVQHARRTVRFSDGVKTLLDTLTDPIFIEVGPGKILSGLVRQAGQKSRPLTVSLLGRKHEINDEVKTMTEQVGRLWNSGVAINWNNFNGSRNGRRVSLPTYSFEKLHYDAEVDPLANLSRSLGERSADLSNQSVSSAMPEADRIESQPKIPAIYTETEGRLIQIMENFFGKGAIGIEDNFFDLGGDSLRAIVLVNRIKKEFDIEFPVKSLFGTKSIKEMASEIEEHLWVNKGTEKRFISTI